MLGGGFLCEGLAAFFTALGTPRFAFLPTGRFAAFFAAAIFKLLRATSQS
jgi:hypothetical protein